MKVQLDEMNQSRSFADLLPIHRMTVETGGLSRLPRIDLTATPDFALGAARVRPSTCEVQSSRGAIRLQHKVMQVLVALAEAVGAVVSRDVLRARCWGGQVVGDDSINRCIQRLRQLSEVEAPGSFTLETLPRLGYRLTAAKGEAAAPETLVPRHREPWLVLAGGAAAVAAIGVAAAMWSPPPARWSVERSERLVSTPLIQRHPAISPDGTMLAFSAGPDVVSRHIFLKPLAGGNPIQLTDDGFDDAAPDWSPDGARILYTAYRAGEPCRIMVTAVPAGPARQLARCQRQERSRAAWSARGEALFFADNAAPAGGARVMRLDLATGRRQAISHPPGGMEDDGPAVSPDGRWLAIFRHSETRSLAVLHDLRTGHERTIAELGDNAGLAWASDSRTLFLAGGNVDSKIWAWRPPSGPRVQVAAVPMTVGRLAFGRGGLLAAEIVAGRFNAVRPPGPGATAPEVVDPASGMTWSPAYSPDGTLAVASDRSGETGIWLSRPGAPARLLIDLGGDPGFDLSWSPDGASLAFVTGHGGAVTVRVAGTAGETRASVPVPGVETGQPAWGADSRSLVFPVRDGGGWRLWRADLARAGRPWPITGYGWADVRASGDTLYAVRSDRLGIWRLGLAPRLIAAGFSDQPWQAWTIYHDQAVFDVGGEAAQEAWRHRPLSAPPSGVLEDAGRAPGYLHRLMSAPLSGGAARAFADLPGAAYFLDFDIDPRSGKPTYIAVLNFDNDIELFHLARK